MRGIFGEQLFALKASGDSCVSDFSSRREGFCNNCCRFKLADKVLLDVGAFHHLGQERFCLLYWLRRRLSVELMYQAMLELVCMQQIFSGHAFTFAWGCIFEEPVIKRLSALPKPFNE